VTQQDEFYQKEKYLLLRHLQLFHLLPYGIPVGMELEFRLFFVWAHFRVYEAVTYFTHTHMV